MYFWHCVKLRSNAFPISTPGRNVDQLMKRIYNSLDFRIVFNELWIQVILLIHDKRWSDFTFISFDLLIADSLFTAYPWSSCHWSWKWNRGLIHSHCFLLEFHQLGEIDSLKPSFAIVIAHLCPSVLIGPCDLTISPFSDFIGK